MSQRSGSSTRAGKLNDRKQYHSIYLAVIVYVCVVPQCSRIESKHLLLNSCPCSHAGSICCIHSTLLDVVYESADMHFHFPSSSEHSALHDPHLRCTCAETSRAETHCTKYCASFAHCVHGLHLRLAHTSSRLNCAMLWGLHTMQT